MGVYCDIALLEKIKDVAVHSGFGLNEIISEAFADRINRYEKEIGGPVPRRKSQKLRAGRKIAGPREDGSKGCT